MSEEGLIPENWEMFCSNCMDVIALIENTILHNDNIHPNDRCLMVVREMFKNFLSRFQYFNVLVECNKIEKNDLKTLHVTIEKDKVCMLGLSKVRELIEKKWEIHYPKKMEHELEMFR